MVNVNRLDYTQHSSAPTAHGYSYRLQLRELVYGHVTLISQPPAPRNFELTAWRLGQTPSPVHTAHS